MPKFITVIDGLPEVTLADERLHRGIQPRYYYWVPESPGILLISRGEEAAELVGQECLVLAGFLDSSRIDVPGVPEDWEHRRVCSVTIIAPGHYDLDPEDPLSALPESFIGWFMEQYGPSGEFSVPPGQLPPPYTVKRSHRPR